ncbi:unnamed protein product [Arabis nemorensis]|uniref:ABC transporter domain-containing protein n=1 Tax=Arabis nemorensis TaxID=586526 RepID=A0A565BVL7_9BRAS|nr:unnamed protein product [Arabis nemorensis]
MRRFMIFFALHLSCLSMFRAIASIFRDFVVATTIRTISIMLLSLFGGFIVRKPSMPACLEWGFWFSPLSYAEIGLTANEFFAPRWRKVTNSSMNFNIFKNSGEQVLDVCGLNFGSQSYWTAFGALIGFALFFNTVFCTGLDISIESRSIVSREKNKKISEEQSSFKLSSQLKKALPFKPLTFTFQDVQYFIETPQGKKLQLLSGITGAFKPDVLTALMGVSRAEKTTLLDVLSGRKTRESLKYSALLGFPSNINSETKHTIVEEVLEMIELEEMKDSIVGIPGVNGLTTEQHARAAAIVMRDVKNMAETGRTVVCTIHQPGIDIFEAFDELILIENGGNIIYYGPLGQHSSKVIEYFMHVSGNNISLIGETVPIISLASSSCVLLLCSVAFSSGRKLRKSYQTGTLRAFKELNLFAGYVMPKPNIPRWWIWMYYLSPTSRILNGLLTSQYGDMEKEISAFGEKKKKKVSAFLEDYFGYRYDSLTVVALVLIAFSILLASFFDFFIGKLNFQKK